MKLPLDLAPRITAADEAGDMASLERALPEVSAMLLMKCVHPRPSSSLSLSLSFYLSIFLSFFLSFFLPGRLCGHMFATAF